MNHPPLQRQTFGGTNRQLIPQLVPFTIQMLKV
jgi:hypothetical protein